MLLSPTYATRLTLIGLALALAGCQSGRSPTTPHTPPAAAPQFVVAPLPRANPAAHLMGTLEGPTTATEYEQIDLRLPALAHTTGTPRWIIDPPTAGRVESMQGMTATIRLAGVAIDSPLTIRAEIGAEPDVSAYVTTLLVQDAMRTAPDLAELDFQSVQLLDRTDRTDRTATTLRFACGGDCPSLHVNQLVIGSAGRGYMGRIQTIAQEGDILTLDIAPASLVEVIQAGHLTLEIPLEETDHGLVPTQEPERTGAADYDIVSLHEDFSAWAPFYKKDGITLRADGNLQGRLYLTLEAEIGWVGLLPGLTYAKAALNGQLSTLMLARLQGSGTMLQAGALAPIPLVTDLLVFWGPAPILVNFSLIPDYTFEASYQADIALGLQGAMGLNIGAEFRDGAWNPILTHNFRMDAIPPLLTAQALAEGEIGVTADLEFLIGGLAGPDIRIRPFVAAEVATQLDPSCLSWKVHRGLGAAVSITGKVWDITLADWQLAEWEDRALLFAGTSPTGCMLDQQPTITSISPGTNPPDNIPVGTPNQVLQFHSTVAHGAAKYLWDFRLGAIKVGADGPTTTVRLGPPGLYTGTLYVWNGAGSDQRDFKFRVIASAGLAPTVTITAPAANSIVTVGQPIQVRAVASDADGAVVQASFFAQSIAQGEVAGAGPYAHDVTFDAADGPSGTIRVSVRDNAGLLGSAEIPVVLQAASGGPQPGNCGGQLPLSRSDFGNSELVDFSVNLSGISDPDSTRLKVQFAYHGPSTHSSSLSSLMPLPLSEAFNPFHDVRLTTKLIPPTSPGAYVLEVYVVDDSGIPFLCSSASFSIASGPIPGWQSFHFVDGEPDYGRGGSNAVGLSPALGYRSNGWPVVAYTDISRNQIVVARAQTTNPQSHTDWQFTVVDSPGQLAGGGLSLLRTSESKWLLVYVALSGGTGRLRGAVATDAATSWTTYDLDATNNCWGYSPTLAMNDLGVIAVSYWSVASNMRRLGLAKQLTPSGTADWFRFDLVASEREATALISIPDPPTSFEKWAMLYTKPNGGTWLAQANYHNPTNPATDWNFSPVHGAYGYGFALGKQPNGYLCAAFTDGVLHLGRANVTRPAGTADWLFHDGPTTEGAPFALSLEMSSTGNMTVSYCDTSLGFADTRVIRAKSSAPVAFPQDWASVDPTPSWIQNGGMSSLVRDPSGRIGIAIYSQRDQDLAFSLSDAPW